MNVFKTYLKLIPSYLNSITMYMIIFVVLLLLSMTGSDGVSSGSGVDRFKALVAINDLDDTAESRALAGYLEENPNITVPEIDFERENAAQDSLYYRKAEYILTIEKGYGEKLRAGKTDGSLSSEVISGSSYEMYVNSQIDSYLSTVRIYMAGGYEAEEALDKAADRTGGIEVSSYERDNGWTDDNRGAYLFFNFMPYIMLLMVLQTLVPTFDSFMNNDVRSRTLCSPISAAAYMAQVIGGAFIVCLCIMAVLIAAGIIITGGNIFGETAGYSFLQMFIFMLFCLALSGFVGILCSGAKKSENYVTSMVSNVLGLGMSFLCGVFVPQSLLGSNILNAGKLFPAYWYVRGNNMIMGGDGAVFDEKEIWTGIVIQALFALAVFAAALLTAVLKKGKRT
mgnify:CR=1 FL=1